MNANRLRFVILLGIASTIFGAEVSAQSSNRRVIRSPQPPTRIRRVPTRVPVKRAPTRVQTTTPKYRLKTSTPSDSQEAKSTKRTSSTMPKKSGNVESDLWSYLERTKYRYWSPGPGETDGFYNAQSPHGPFAKKYLNRKAAGRPDELPSGSILVTENYSADRTLNAITVMFRIEDSNPDASDWYWVAYNPDGSVARTSEDTGKQQVAGAVESCISCHQRAEGNDFVFFND